MSYTNATAADGPTVIKRYLGPDAEPRRRREVIALRHLQGRVPVPEMLAEDDRSITVSRLPGTPGQELLEEVPGQVLVTVGRLARAVHSVPIETWPAPFGGLDPADGAVLVHGDFGPQNLLLDPITAEPTGVLDWEFSHPGQPVEDLAWAEWIVRTHHPHLIAALPALWEGYGCRFPWADRHASMLIRCQELLAFCRRWAGDDSAAVRSWRARLVATSAYLE